MDKLRLAILALAICVVGCTDNSDGLTQQQTVSGTRQKEILERSGGDWNKLTDADRQYLLSLTNGNERVAKMKFGMMSGNRPNIGPGSPPPGGAPFGGPQSVGPKGGPK